jgi:hypothetical protein
MSVYTVIGTDLDSGPVAVAIEADSPQQAEIRAPDSLGFVAAVLLGEVAVDEKGVFDEGTNWTVFGFDTATMTRVSQAVRARTFKEAEELVSFGKNGFLASGVARGLKSRNDDYALGKPEWAARDFSLRSLEHARELERDEPYGAVPRFRHDCDECEFVGHYKGADVWLPVHEGSGSIIVRHSSVGEDYDSGSQVLWDEEWLEADDTERLRHEIAKKMFEPQVLAAVAQSGGHPPARSRLSPLAAPAPPVSKPTAAPAVDPTLER